MTALRLETLDFEFDDSAEGVKNSWKKFKAHKEHLKQIWKFFKEINVDVKLS